MHQPDPMHQCTAKSKKTKNRCQNPAISGGTVCRMHGGAAPQVKERARLRLLELVDPTLARFAMIVRSKKSKDSDAVAAGKEILARAGIGEATKLELSGELKFSARDLTDEQLDAAIRDALASTGLGAQLPDGEKEATKKDSQNEQRTFGNN